MQKLKNHKKWIVIALIAVFLVVAGLCYVLSRGQDEKNQPDNSFIGLTEQEAKTKAKAEGLEYRVVERDCKNLREDISYNAQRINVFVKDGEVVEARLDSDSKLDNSFGNTCPNSDSFVGLTEQEVEEKAKAVGLRPRVVQRDGKNLGQTQEFDPYRISLWIKDGKVIEAKFDRDKP